MRNFAAGFVSALLMVAAVGVFGRAMSEEVWVVVSGLAKHLDHREHCNSVTSGLGLEARGYAVGFYRNSNCRWSTYAAKTWLPLKVGEWKAGAISGVVTGYKNSLLPAAALALTYEQKGWGFNLIGVPPFKESAGGVVWAQLKFRW